MSRKYTNKELRASLIALDQVLHDILSNAYEYMEVIDQEIKKIKNKTDDSSYNRTDASTNECISTNCRFNQFPRASCT